MECASGADGERSIVFSPRIGSPIGFCEARARSRKDPDAQAASKWVRPIFFVQAAARCGLQLRKASRWLFSMGASHFFGRAAVERQALKEVAIKEVGPTRRNPCPRTSNPCAASPPLDEFGSTVVFEAAFNGEHGVGSAFEQRCLSPYPRKMGRTRMGCTLGAYGEWSVVRWA